MFNRITKNHNIIALFLCIAGTALNVLLNSMANTYGLPFYFDTIGTVLAAALGGYLPGIIVGFVTNIIEGIFDVQSLYYGVVNVLIAVFTAYMVRHGWFEKITGIIGAILVFSLIGGGIGSLIPWFLSEQTSINDSLSTVLNGTGHFSPFLSHVLSNILIDIPDKAITVLILTAVLHLIPKRFSSCFGFTAWQQNPAAMDQTATPKKQKETVRFMSVRTKLLLTSGGALAIVSLLAIFISLTVYTRIIKRERTELATETARIIAVADAYVTMTSKKRYRDARPVFEAREAFVKGSGEVFDPRFSDIMVKIIDEDSKNDTSQEEPLNIETELICTDYRLQISNGIPVDEKITKVSFDYTPLQEEGAAFSAPAVILFDSFDQRVHDNEKSIKANKYSEYGELWFDEHSVTTTARRIEETVNEKKIASEPGKEGQKYEILMGRYEDHLKLRMTSPSFEKDVIIALPNRAMSSYIALTGEHCVLRNITVKKTERTVGPDDIPEIVDEISYIDRMESDIKNIQIDRTRSAATDGIEIKERLKLKFHTMSLPSAHLVWHCPYIILFSSKDGQVNGENYKEYASVKLYGENDGNNKNAENSLTVKRTEEFPGWDTWKEFNKRGMECEVAIRRKNGRILLKTKNLGLELENITTLPDDPEKVYVALSGDQVAITDIRVL